MKLERKIMYSLILLFLLIPLYFSHILAPFGVIIGETSSFERQKMYLFVFLILIAFLEILWTRYDVLFEKFRKNWMYFFLLFAIPFFSSLFWGTKLDASFFFGSLEKHHGYIFFAGVILLALLIQTLSPKGKSLVIKASLVSGLLVSFFALLEYMGISVFYGNLSGASWGSGRSISTLGNPNYVAGYLLMLLPFIRTIRSPERYVLVSIFIMAILVTKSFIAIFLLVLYGVWTLLSYGGTKYLLRLVSEQIPPIVGMTKLKYQTQRNSFLISGILVLLIGIMVIVSVYSFLPPDKLLSLTSRFVLMRETFSAMLQYPFSFLIGFGPDTIIQAYEGTRSAVIGAYFPSGSAIDSSHNIVIDIFFQYGILPIILIPYFLWKNWKNISLAGREGLLLGFGFLSLNPYVLSHAILLVLLTTTNDRKNS